MSYYEFSVFYKGTLEYASSWYCDAKSVKEAVMKFIHQLSDLSICEDEYEVAIGYAIIEKLAGKEYETEPCDDYTNIIAYITAEDIYKYI